MKIVIPMAGRGTRLRPHTLTVPKPLIPIAGKPIVQRLVEDLAKTIDETIDDIAFVIGDFGVEVEKELLALAEKVGAKGHIFYQTEQLGTAHAILCAQSCLDGPVLVAFADTLFKADFKMDSSQDGVIWVQSVENPSAYGVIKMNDAGDITDFVEKPKDFISDLAIIGIYYVKDGANLRSELQYLLDNDIKQKGEYQLTDALENMRKKGLKFRPGKIEEWLDFGSKDLVLYSTGRVLEFCREEQLARPAVQLENSVVIEPCYIGAGSVIKNSVIGPNVSIGDNCVVEDSVIKQSLIQNKCKLSSAVLYNSMVGNFAEYSKRASELSIGDYVVVTL